MSMSAKDSTSKEEWIKEVLSDLDFPSSFSDNLSLEEQEVAMKECLMSPDLSVWLLIIVS